MAILNFQQPPVFSVTWSFRNHSNNKKYIYYYKCWKPFDSFLQVSLMKVQKTKFRTFCSIYNRTSDSMWVHKHGKQFHSTSQERSCIFPVCSPVMLASTSAPAETSAAPIEAKQKLLLQVRFFFFFFFITIKKTQYAHYSSLSLYTDYMYDSTTFFKLVFKGCFCFTIKMHLQ